MNPKNIFLVLCLFFFLPFLCKVLPIGEDLGDVAIAQGEANIWYFGRNAGLDFNGGAPFALVNGQVNAWEGCASISDVAGNLLFYTDGVQVWNKSHIQMSNGFGLLGNNSSTQSGVIIQKPGSVIIYYIFTADYESGSNGIRYTEIDMTINAGLGNVTTNKNILLNAPSCEKITAVRHCNNKDVWVVTHDWNSNAFRTYLVTAAGVNPIPVVSNAGVVATGVSGVKIGQLKCSPDGTKLASAIWSSSINRFELFDFNNSSGIVSNTILFPQVAGGAYGVEFSPDGTKLYGTTYNPRNLYQFDLCSGSSTAIANSGVLIGTSSSSFGSLQLGPDKKIYVARDNTPWLGVINNPNTLGVGCNYVVNGISLTGQNSALGLPNFVSYYFKPPPPPFIVSDTCLIGTFTAPTVNITNCSGSSNAITSVSWNFGDPASAGNNTSTITNPTHIFTNAGTYTVTLVLNYTCGSDTIKQNVTVVNCGFTATTTPTNVLCNGKCTGTATANPSGGALPYTYLWNTIPAQTTQTATGLCAGSYTVTVVCTIGSTTGATIATTATVTITQPPALTAAISLTPAPGITATVNPSGGTLPYTYLWNTAPPQTTQTATGLTGGVYCCTITDANNCTHLACVTVPVESPCDTAGELFFPNAFSPNGDGENDFLKIYYADMICIKSLSLVVYDRWGEKVFETTDAGKSWDGKYNGQTLNTQSLVYYLRVEFTDEILLEKKGNVSLVR